MPNGLLHERRERAAAQPAEPLPDVQHHEESVTAFRCLAPDVPEAGAQPLFRARATK